MICTKIWGGFLCRGFRCKRLRQPNLPPLRFFLCLLCGLSRPLSFQCFLCILSFLLGLFKPSAGLRSRWTTQQPCKYAIARNSSLAVQAKRWPCRTPSKSKCFPKEPEAELKLEKKRNEPCTLGGCFFEGTNLQDPSFRKPSRSPIEQ